MDKTTYRAIDACLRSLFDHYSVQLSNESKENVQHYIEAAEIEMACESFVLSLLEEQVQMSIKDKKELRDLAMRLQLDKNSVFRGDFWEIADFFFRGE